MAEMPDGVVGAANTQLCSGEVDDGRRPKRCGLAGKCEQLQSRDEIDQAEGCRIFLTMPPRYEPGGLPALDADAEII